MSHRFFGLALPAALCLAMSCPCTAGSPPLEVVEKASREGFPLERRFLDGASGAPREIPMEACGVYLRSRGGGKLYALCVYVDLRQLLALTRGHARTPRRVADLLMSGKIPHAFVSRFVQPLPRANRMAFLKGHLETYWPGGGFDERAAGLPGFLGFFDTEIKAGTETQVWIDDAGAIYTREAGGTVQKTVNPKLCQAFTASYFAKQPMDLVMRDSLLNEMVKVLDVEDLMSGPIKPARR